MPVQIQCTAVVIRNDALDRCLDGGSSEFPSIARNSICYSDDLLSQASFMSQIDAEQFAKSLELRGLGRGNDPDFVIVQEKDRSVRPPCDWLHLFEYESRLIATVVGSDNTTVIAPAMDHDPDSMQHFTGEEARKYLEFVERKNRVDTYRHRETGELYYSARHTETDDEIFKRVAEIVWNHRRHPGDGPIAEASHGELREAIEQLQGLLVRNPEEVKVAMHLGLAWFSLGNAERAQASLEKAHALAPESYAILKELGSCLLDQRDFPAAVSVAEKAVAIEPENIELLGNLAVSQLLAGDVAKGKRTIGHAVSLDRSDVVNKNIASIVEEIDNGNRPLPKSLEEMMQPYQRPSLIARLLKKFKK